MNQAITSGTEWLRSRARVHTHWAPITWKATSGVTGKSSDPYIHKSFWSFLLCTILSSYGNHHLPTLCSVAQSCLSLCSPLNCSPPGSSSRGFSKGEYWSGLPFPSPGDLPDSGIEPASLASPTWAERFFTISATGEAPQTMWFSYWCYYLFFVSSS